MLDQTCDEVYFKTIVDAVEAYSRVGSPEAASRKLAVLMAWVIASRASESAWLTFDGMHFDQFFSKVFQEVPQEEFLDMRYALAPPPCLTVCSVNYSSERGACGGKGGGGLEYGNF